MTNEEINAAIVKVLGTPDRFLLKKRGYYYRPNAEGYTACIGEAWVMTKEEAQRHVYPHDEPVTMRQVPNPDYCTDLNACADFEKTLTSISDRSNYLEQIVFIELRGREGNEMVSWRIRTASPLTLCQAYLRFKGLWVEGAKS